MANTDNAPSRIGPVLIERTLGVGGMGQVFAGRHEKLGRMVAVKTLLPHLAEDPGLRERFLREARAMARINHPNVVQVFEVGPAEGAHGEPPYLIMELLTGETLDSWIRVRDADPAGGPRPLRRLPVEEALDLLLPAIAAVAAGHDAGVIHRDLTPRNIFRAVSPRGEVTTKVLDFGIAKVLDDRGVEPTRLGSRLGTLAYSSPEQLVGAPIDAATDQFSLAAILYEALCARRARPGSTEMQLFKAADGEPTPLRAVAADLPAELEGVVMRALSKDPARRFPSLYHFAAELMPFASASARVRWEQIFGRSAVEHLTAPTANLGASPRDEQETVVPSRAPTPVVTPRSATPLVTPPLTDPEVRPETEVLGPKPSPPSAGRSAPPASSRPGQSTPPRAPAGKRPVAPFALAGAALLAVVVWAAWPRSPHPDPGPVTPDEGMGRGPIVATADTRQQVVVAPDPPPPPPPPPPDPLEAATAALQKQAVKAARGCGIPESPLKLDITASFKVQGSHKVELLKVEKAKGRASNPNLRVAQDVESVALKTTSCVVDRLGQYRVPKDVPTGSKLTVHFSVGLRI